MAYIKDIVPNSPDSHQTAPAYMLTFVRWGVRDTNTINDINLGISVKEPLIVINDCVSLNVSMSKRSHIQGASMVLLAGEVNYSAAVAPGDFVFINMLDNDEKLFGKGGSHSKYNKNSLFDRALNKQPINGSHDGFKGIFKVSAVRKFLQVNKSNGVKTVNFQITAQAFTELDQVIYFNSYAFDAAKDGDRVLTSLNGQVAKDFLEKQTKEDLSLASIYKLLMQYTLGGGFPPDFAPTGKDVTVNYNKNFKIPSGVANFIGLKGARTASDIFTHYIGIQKYNNRAVNETVGLNPIHTRAGAFLDCGASPSGSTLIIGEYWNQVTAWSLINQYINPSVNEIFTCFRLIPEGKVVPCIVFRQKPFTSDKFNKENPSIDATVFSSLPRWRIDPSLIYSYSLGRDNSARINFVQVIGKSRLLSFDDIISWQSSLKSWVEDDEDIQRNGLKPFITTSDFDFPTTDQKASLSPNWTKLNYDWLNNGHLKENGKITCSGIEEPISVGDNLEFDGVIYHIEEINHSMTTGNDGHKTFETSVNISYGVSKQSNTSVNAYPEDSALSSMDDRRDSDYNSGNRTIPGVSDDQEGSSQASRGSRVDKKAPDFLDLSSKVNASKILNKK
jgi:hypothetical protein